MSKHKLLLSGSIIAILVMVMAILCTLPVDPKDPSNTKVNIVLRTTDKTDINFLEDTAGNRIRIGAALNLPENIDSVNLKIVYGNTIVFDTMFKDIQPTSDTLWKDIIFYTEGTRTITLTPYSSLALPSPSATIKIIGKQFPVNSAPTLIVNGNRVIKPTETCSLTIQASDSDSDQELTVFMANNPDGSQLIKNNTQFVWTAPAAFIGNTTVTFTVIDNGKPPMSASSDVIITVTATPHPPVIRVSGNFTLKPLETCSLTVSVSDEDVGQVLEIAMSGQPNGAQLVDDSIFLWTVPADFTGEKTVTFTVTDNGEPPLSSSVQATIILSAASVNSAPEWDTKTLPVPLKDTATYVKNLTDVCHDVDGDKITFTLINGTPAGDTILEATYSFVAKPALVGTYKVKIIAADPKGAADTLTIDLSVTSSTAVDVTPPTITLVAPPKDSFEVSTPTCLIDVISSDVSGIASVVATFGGTTLPMQSTAGHYTVTMGGLKAGEYNKIDLVATDASVVGNKKTLVVYIKYNPGFTITYDGNGSTGGSVPIDTVSYAAGAMVTVRANSGNLVKTGTTFAGWNTAADGSGTSYAPGETLTMGTMNNTLYAKWSTDAYTITYNLDGGTNSASNPPTYSTTAPAITLADPTKTGYAFGGWYANSELTGTAVTSIPAASTGDKAFWAKWTIQTYAVTYNLDGGTNNAGNPASYTVVTVTITLANPTKAGYSFDGWYANSGSTGTAITSIPAGSTGDKIFWAKWSPDAYTITYNLDGGTNNASNPATYNTTSPTISLAEPTKAGYTFGGWYANSGLTGTAVISIPAASTGDKAFWAKWTIQTYTITYNLDGGTNNAGNPASYTVVTASITLADPTKTGNIFSGWYTNSGFTGTAVSSIPAGSTGDKVFWAKWTKVFKVTYNANTGSGTVPVDPNSYQNSNTVTVLSGSGLSKIYYTFAGWNTQADTLGTSYTGGGQFTMGSADVVLYAKWRMNLPTVSTLTNKTCPVNDSVTFSVAATGANLSYVWQLNGAPITGASGTSYTTSKLTKNDVTAARNYTCVVTNPAGSINCSATLSVSTVTDADANVYHEVKMGGRIWMMENLKTTRYRDGTRINSQSTSASDWTYYARAFAWPEYNANNNVYGMLYNWACVQNGQLAPAGWRLPTEAEWAELFHSDDGCGLFDYDHFPISLTWACPADVSPNTTGFSVMGNGMMGGTGEPGSFNSKAYWWTSETSVRAAIMEFSRSWYKHFSLDSEDFSLSGCGIRCIKE